MKIESMEVLWKQLTQFKREYKKKISNLEEEYMNAQKEVLSLEEKMIEYYEENNINPDEKFQDLSESCGPKIDNLWLDKGNMKGVEYGLSS